METIELQELGQRTRARNALTWLTLDFGGVMTPLLSEATELGTLGAPSIENFILISDETWGDKVAQRDRLVQVSQDEVDQDRYLADVKAATLRAKIAIERTADEYELAVKIRDAVVKGLIMGAREYAGVVEQEQLAAEGVKASVDVEKEVVRQGKIASEICIEAIEAAQVQADIAKAQVEVAKAHVRAAIAGIEAGKAEVEVIEAQVQVVMTEAEKSTLQADVATILAEIVTKELSTVKLGVGAAEIAAGFAIIQSKLSDAQELYTARALVESIKAAAEGMVQAEIGSFIGAKATEASLREAEADVPVQIASYEAGAAAANVSAEAGIRQALVAARIALSSARTGVSIGRDNAQTWAQAVMNAAHIIAYTSGVHYRETTTDQKSTRKMDTVLKKIFHNVTGTARTESSFTESTETIAKG